MSTDLDKVLANATVRPAEELAKQVRAPRNQGTPLDEQVWDSYANEQPMEITPVPQDQAQAVKRMLEKSARYLTRTEEREIKVSVKIVPIGRGKVTVQFLAREPMMTGARMYRAMGKVPQRRR